MYWKVHTCVDQRMMVKLCWRKIYLEICTNTCAWKYTGNMNLEIYTWKYFGKSTCNLCGLWLTMTNEHLANKFIHVLMVTRPYWSRAADVLAPVRVEQNNYTRALQIQYSCDLRLCVVSNKIITSAPYKYSCDLRLSLVTNRIITHAQQYSCNVTESQKSNYAPYKYTTLVIFGFPHNNPAGATILL